MLDKDEMDAAVAYNRDRVNRRDERPHWERLARLVVLFQHERGLVADGKLGPKTIAELDLVWSNPPASGDELVDAIFGGANRAVEPIVWPAFDGPLERRPETLREIVAVFGNPADADGNESLEWKTKHLVDRGPDDPLPGCPVEGPGRYVVMHRLIEPYAEEGLRRAQIAAPYYGIRRIGCHNFRRMRHDTPEKAAAEKRPLRPLSKHAWAIALDINPDDNRARQFEAGATPEPWSPEWDATWPRGLPREFVEAMESVGWRWGGRWKGFVDPMHFEFCGGDADDVEV